MKLKSNWKWGFFQLGVYRVDLKFLKAPESQYYVTSLITATLKVDLCEYVIQLINIWTWRLNTCLKNPVQWKGWILYCRGQFDSV